MIRKLRRKLIGVSMLSVFLVFSVILSVTGVISYWNVIEVADSTLEILADNNGFFPRNKNMDLPREGGRGGMGRQMSPELPYESRYFSVLFNEDRKVVLADTGKIAAVDTEAAIQYAEKVLDGNRSEGFIRDYRYMMTETDGGFRVIFLDCGRSLSSLRTFLLTGMLVFLGGMIAVWILIIVFSRYMVKPVAESYEKQKRFISDAGHEIKTPLTIIDADADVLSMDIGENEWITDIKSQTRRLTALTNDLILLSRMEEEKTPVCAVEFPISDLAEETARSFQALAVTQKKIFLVKIQPMLSFCGDEKMIRELLIILLDNALKYAPEDGTISFSVEKSGRNIQICVYNTTDYISREHLPHLFDRFYRADQSRNSMTGGHGLGLSIASAVVAAHKGKISAETADEHSLLITVQLPGEQVQLKKRIPE